MPESKKELRRQVLQQRQLLDETARRRMSAAICDSVIEILAKRHLQSGIRGSLFTFMPFGHEADIFPVAEWCWKQGIPVVASKTIREPRSLRLHEVSGPQDLVSGVWGIPEPVSTAPLADPAKIATILVPGVAFDRSGGRLGYGGGYYDRLFESLKGAGCHPYKLSPAFGLQIVDRVPMEEHDEKVDLLITEEEIIEISKNEPGGA